VIDRPPLGFVVEGHGEFHCYPSLFCRVVGLCGPILIPRVNAGSCGALVTRLKEQLTALNLVHKPLEVIITVDLADVLKQGIYLDCGSLCEALHQQTSEWLVEAASDRRLSPLPQRITTVIQIPKFESWLIADVNSLIKAGYLRHNTTQIENSDDTDRPEQFLGENLTSKSRLKNPIFAKKLVSKLNPVVMRKHSRSFDKFFRETTRAYSAWLELCRATS